MRLVRLLTYSTLILAAAISGRVARHAIAAETEKVDVTPAKPNRPISLRDRLLIGLEARLKAEVAFVDAVVAAVGAGRLPQRLVDETFFWSRQRAMIVRNGHTDRPIIYFMPGMRARANLLHVSL